jgi:hypothetical protein
VELDGEPVRGDAWHRELLSQPVTETMELKNQKAIATKG